MNHERSIKALERQFSEGPLPPGESAALREHVRGCTACRAHYGRLIRMEQLFEGARTPVAQIERMAALPAPGARSPGRRLWPVLAPLAIAAGIAVVFIAPPDPPVGGTTGTASEYSGRGSGGEKPLPFIRVLPFEEASKAKRSPDGRLRPGEGLLFQYVNPDSSFRYVMIAGVDAAGAVHWYHPAYESVKDDPRSVPIRQTKKNAELGAVNFADHAPGKLEICALFTEEPLRLRPIDDRLESGGGWPGDVLRNCLTIEVIE